MGSNATCATCGCELVDYWVCRVFIHLHSLVGSVRAESCSCCACLDSKVTK